jgi:zeaxanthin glucosyltransferase
VVAKINPVNLNETISKALTQEILNNLIIASKKAPAAARPRRFAVPLNCRSRGHFIVNAALSRRRSTSMKIGFVSLPLWGHLNPMISLAREVKSQGHEVVFIGVEDAAPPVMAAGLDFHVIAQEEVPRGRNDEIYRSLARLRGLDIIRYFAETGLALLCKATLEHLPGAITALGIDALAIDTIYFFTELAAIRMNIPYVHISNVLHMDPTGATPPCQFSFPYEDSAEARARNTAAIAEVGKLLLPVIHVAVDYAKKHSLPIDWSVRGSTVSQTAVLTQIPKVFDFPKVGSLPQFHYTGPFHDAGARAAVPFPWERLNGKRIIYASLGTMVNGLEHVYRKIASACSSVPDTQLVLSIGDHIEMDELGVLPEDAIVVRKAPQPEILKQASLCITHAGANTVLESQFLLDSISRAWRPVSLTTAWVSSLKKSNSRSMH